MSIRAIRAGKPAYYPDQTIYAEFAAGVLGLDFAELDGGTGLIFEISGSGRRIAFGAGRGSFFPQNTATAATLANDKHMANRLMARAGLATLGGDYFFLHDRHRSHRPPGHERSDLAAYFAKLDETAFVKPLNGSRGDFAQSVRGADELAYYLDAVARHYDAVLMQPIHTGREFRIVVLDDDIVYSVEKSFPVMTGDGTTSLGALIAAEQPRLIAQGVSAAPLDHGADRVLAAGEHYALHGRTNLSAGGLMQFCDPPDREAVFAIARRAVHALGLRAGAVDLFVAEPTRVIEVNANPSIRFLETADRADLILRIWRHTFTALGLIDV